MLLFQPRAPNPGQRLQCQDGAFPRQTRLRSHALGAAALTVITAVAVLRAGQAVQTPLPSGQQAPPATQQAPPAGQQQPAQQQPVFRAGVKLVRVDVTVTGKGDLPVADLTPADFEVAEDGAPQKVEQLQFVRLDGQRPAGDETSLEIRSQDQAEAEAARDDVRVFAIFFDDYHVDKAPQITIPMRQGLSLFVNRLWPTDLVAIMDPLTTLSALRFTRSKSELQAAVNKFEGRQGEIFPIKSVMEEAQLMRGDIRRVRAQVTFSALAALTMKLGGMREGRKSIIFVSQGPPTYLGVARRQPPGRDAHHRRGGQPRQRRHLPVRSHRSVDGDAAWAIGARSTSSPPRRAAGPSSTRTTSPGASSGSSSTTPRTTSSATRRRGPRTTGSTTRSP